MKLLALFVTLFWIWLIAFIAWDVIQIGWLLLKAALV